jgi:hypothetical protein
MENLSTLIKLHILAIILNIPYVKEYIKALVIEALKAFLEPTIKSFKEAYEYEKNKK